MRVCVCPRARVCVWEKVYIYICWLWGLEIAEPLCIFIKPLEPLIMDLVITNILLRWGTGPYKLGFLWDLFVKVC